MKKTHSSIFNLKMNPQLQSLLFLVHVLLFGFTNLSIAATDNGGKTGVSIMSRDALQVRIEAINSRQGIDEAFKTKILKFYQSSQDNLNNIENFKTQETNFKLAIKKGPDTIKKLQKEIEQTQTKLNKQNPEDFSQIPIEELDQRLIIEKGKISNLDDQLKKLETDLALQGSRPQSIRQEMLIAQQDLEDTHKKLEIQPAGSNSPLEVEARQTYLKTLNDSRTAELKMLDVEAISNPIRVDLLKIQLQLLYLQKNALTLTVNSIETLMTEHRQQEAKTMQDALSQAEKELSGKHILIQTLTRKNIQYSKDLQIITDRIEHYSEEKTKLDALISQIDNDYKSAEKKISLAGLSPALGKILHKQRRNLLDQDPFTLESEVIQSETASTSLEQFKVDDLLKQHADVDSELNDVMNLQVDPSLPVEQRMMIQAEVRILINNQRELLNKLSIAYSTYLRVLGDFDFASQQLVSLKEKFAAYLDEKLLWVKSSEPINTNFFNGLYHSLQWLLSPFNWIIVIKDTIKLASSNLFLALAGLFSFGILLAVKKQAKQKMSLISEKVEKIYSDNFNYTLIELAYTIIIVFPLPFLLNFLGRFLSDNGMVSNFTNAIGEGFQVSSIPLFFLQLFYRLFAPKGIVRNHFQWPEDITRLLRQQIAWLRFIAIPGIFIINSTGASKIAEHGDNLGRLALIMIMISIAVFFSRLLNPKQGLFKDYYHLYPEGWLASLRYVWYSASFLVPATIIGFAVAGYYLSALELQQKLLVSLRLIFLFVIVHAMVIRWLTLVNRQLAIKNARQKRKAAALGDKHPVVGSEEPILPVDQQQIDIPKINVQTIKLLNVFIGFSLISSFWIIWKNILPAFSFLDDIVLWQHLATIDNQDSYQPTTLTNLLLAGLYVFLVFVAIRNFYGVMELLVFRRWAIEAGSRYAVNQLARYILVAFGIITVANELGGSWAQVQWLVAALSVGLGFGLQEIFANLVSGIILLFERPIRIGDTVTIGSVTGKVSRIEMRATTLKDVDQKDLIVPNKTFITSQLVNWTLTDSITRLIIPIGIAYHSDVELAHQVMVDAVHSLPQVLAEPEPSVLFTGFGENALNFSISIYVNELSKRLPVTHDLLMRLEKAFRENSIELPYPQRDIHIRSMPTTVESTGLSGNN